MYEAMATRTTPALIIYLIDVSGSMDLEMSTPQGKLKKIDVLPRVIKKAAKKMVQRATKGDDISPRYRVAMFAYSSKVEPVYKDANGHYEIWPIDTIKQRGVPSIFTPQDTTDTYAGFLQVKHLLEQELPKLHPDSPAPLVCHLTDGAYTTQDPTPVVNEIKKMKVNDGCVLVENIYISEELSVSTTDVTEWEGYKLGDNLGNKYGNQLLEMSSPLPHSYWENIKSSYPKLMPNTQMMYPGLNEDFVSLAFVMSTMTKVDTSPASRDK